MDEKTRQQFERHLSFERSRIAIDVENREKLFGFPLEVSDSMPPDEIRLTTASQNVRVVNIGKAIEPDAFTSPSHEARKTQGIASAIGQVATNEGWMTRLEVPKWHPNFYMRALGYTRNPAVCGHEHKRFKTRWVCADCGEELGDE